MHDLIRVYDHALDYNACQTLIQHFDNSPEHQQSKLGPTGFTEVDFTTSGDSKNHAALAAIQMNIINHYIVDCRINKEQQIAMDGRFSFENFRIKRYNPGQSFPLHTDEGGTRRLACLYYLNNDYEGGYTVFPNHNLVITPGSGQVVVFPATWEYLHEGQVVSSGKKYLLSSYLTRNATRN